MRTQFCIYGEPRGKERPKFSTVCGHVTARTPENTVLYENLVKTEYRIQSGVRFADDAMLSVRIFAFLSVPRSASRKKHLAMIDRLIRPTRKPPQQKEKQEQDVTIVEVHPKRFLEQVPADGGSLIERLDNIILECVLLKKEISKAK